MPNNIKLLTVKKRLAWIDDRVKHLINMMTCGQLPYGWVTGDFPIPTTGVLERTAKNNPRGYAMLMEYQALIEEEKELECGPTK